jgi:hypothetical protein
MVPMHLGLIDGLFLPHNLISAKESPVILLKVHMAPRLKILISSGSKKENQIYFLFLSKLHGKRIPSRFPIRASVGRDVCLTDHFYISLNASLYLKGPMKRASLHVSQRRGPYGNRPHSRTLFNIPFRVHIKAVLPKGPPP